MKGFLPLALLGSVVLLGCEDQTLRLGADDGGFVTCGEDTCGGEEYCEEPTGSCGTSSSGVSCKLRPIECGPETVAVCGCDGVNYRNACASHSVGVSLRTEAACPSR